MDNALVALGITIIGAIIWAVRKEGELNLLESRQDGSDKEMDKMKEEVKVIGERLVDELSKIREYLARLDERFSNYDRH